MNDSVQKVIDDLSKHPDIHTIYWGYKTTSGVETNMGCVVCVLEHKLPLTQVVLPINPSITIDGHRIITDVIERKPPEIELLRIGYSNYEELLDTLDTFGRPLALLESPSYSYFSYVGEEHRKCFSPTVLGGAQIAPRGARWVGTHGAACKLDGIHGSLSNWHVLVGGQFTVGDLISQPHGNSGSIGLLKNWVDINFSGGNNRVDCAWFSSQIDSKKTYLTIPEQIGLGRIDPNSMRNPQLGMKVMKSGRTTGVVKTGRVTGVNGTSHVNYGDGKVAKFVDQVIIENDGQGDFSGPGDSGSLVTTEDMRPFALLFAGGNGTTIANPIEHVERELGIRFY